MSEQEWRHIRLGALAYRCGEMYRRRQDPALLRRANRFRAAQRDLERAVDREAVLV